MTINHATPLTFPTLPFAKLAPATFLTAHLSHSPSQLRPSGRTPSETRQPIIHTGSLTHAHGSAVVRCGDTSVVCGVRGEILRAENIADWTPSEPSEKDTHVGGGEKPPSRGNGSGDESESNSDEEELDITRLSSERAQKRRKLEKQDIARLNLLVPNVELATGCSPHHLPGGPPSVQAQVLSQRLLSLLHTADVIPLSNLRIWNDPPVVGPTQESGTKTERETRMEMEDVEQEGLEGKREVKAFWVLYIDIMFLSLSGPPLDSAWLAMLAALRNTGLPRATWDTDKGGVYCDPEPGLATGLGLRDLPIALTCGAFVEEGGSAVAKKERRKWILADPDGFEEGLCKEIITVVLARGDKLLRIEKGGGEGVGGKEVREVVELAARWRRQCVALLES